MRIIHTDKAPAAFGEAGDRQLAEPPVWCLFDFFILLPQLILGDACSLGGNAAQVKFPAGQIPDKIPIVFQI